MQNHSKVTFFIPLLLHHTYQVASSAIDEMKGEWEGNEELAPCPEGGVLVCHPLKGPDHIWKGGIHCKVGDGCC